MGHYCFPRYVFEDAPGLALLSLRLGVFSRRIFTLYFSDACQPISGGKIECFIRDAVRLATYERVSFSDCKKKYHNRIELAHFMTTVT